MKKSILIFLSINLVIMACSLPGIISSSASNSEEPPNITTPSPMSETATPLPIQPETASPSLTSTATATLTTLPSPTNSVTPTITIVPTFTNTIAPSATPTFAFPSVTVNKQAHCRYGPNTAYLHAADLYAGDTGTVRGRFYLNKWLFVKFDKLKYFCWVAPSVVDVVGDINTVKLTDVFLPGPSVLYSPPQGVTAKRDGKKVKIQWEVVPMTEDDDRGYFLDLFVCQSGALLWFPIALDNRDITSYTIKDEAGCSEPSSGKIYAVEKHGYTRPVEINWPHP